jgi:hypothetical protein
MKIIVVFIFAVIVGSSNIAFSQSVDDWMGSYHTEILTTMKINYRKPVDLEEIKGVECFEQNPKLQAILTCVGHQLVSDDGEFLAFIPIYKVFTKADSAYMQKMRPQSTLYSTDKQHINQIKNAISVSLGKEAAQSWKNQVTYYSKNEAIQKFNADSSVFLNIKIDSNNLYKGIYNHLDVLYLQKKGRGFVNFYCFYSDKGKKDLAKYMKSIEGIFRYED